MDRELNRQFKRLDKREQRILNKKENKIIKSKVTPIMNQIQGKIPEKLRLTLEIAFSKSFQLVFEKGDIYIEKTYKKDRIKLEYDLNNYAVDKKLCKKYIDRIDKQADSAKMINTSFTVLEGGVLGFFGIGLPDIPLFIALIMRTIHEVALSYGYDYKSEEEKGYMLLMICGAMSQGEKQKKFNEQINRLGNRIDQQMKIEIDLKELMRDTTEVLAEAMLVGKFVQGIPVVGAVGGLVNYTIIKKIGRYTAIKYKKRYLLKKVRDRE